MYKLDQVISEFNKIVKDFKPDSIQYNYYKIIVKYLLIEHKHSDIVLSCGKPIYHHFQYSLPKHGNDYFEFLYNPYNPVRFAVETFDSIEEIRNELN